MKINNTVKPRRSEKAPKVLKEQDMEDNGYVATDDENKAEDLAKKGVKVKLTKEQEGIEFSKEETTALAKEVGGALVEALRESGDELDTIKGRNIEPNSFEIYVKYKNGFEDEFSFYIDGETLHLVDFSFDKEIGEVGIKPSGEPIVHTDIIKNNLVKHFKALNEQEIDWEDFESASREVEYGKEQERTPEDLNEEDNPRQTYLRILDMYKKASGRTRQELKPKLEKAAKQIGIKTQLDELSQDLYNIEVSEQDSRQATGILSDKYQKEVIYNSSTSYSFEDQQTAYNVLDDFGGNNIEVIDTNLDLLYEKSKCSNMREDLEDRAKIYWMQKVRRGEIDSLPDNPKAAFLDQMTKDEMEDDTQELRRETGLEENKNPELVKYVNRFVGGLASKYGYSTQDAVNAIMGVLRSQNWEGVNEEFAPNIAPGSTYAIQVTDLGNKIALEQDNGQTVVIHKDDIDDVISKLNSLFEIVK